MKITDALERMSEAEAWTALEAIKDPEIPSISVVEMGIVRAIDVDGARVRVAMTPTYSGCPALQVMRDGIQSCLTDLGFSEVTVDLMVSPPWTSDWITESAREKLRAFGIAPPPRIGDGGAVTIELIDRATCPNCGSTEVTRKNLFGPTLCRMIWYCEACLQPFEQFKPI